MTSSRIVAALLIAAALGLGAWWWLGRAPEPVAPVGQPKEGVMTEEERQAYVREHVRAVDLKIGPDLKPGTDEPVPGLLRVTGKVINEGEQTIDTVVVVVLPKDDAGEVIAMDQQDVIIDAPFAPGDIREFRFQIRDRSEFAGAFDHELR